MNKLEPETYAITDTITDAECALDRAKEGYSPLAYEMQRARHQKARKQLIDLVIEVRAARIRATVHVDDLEGHPQ